jgi:hypothetical protein
LLVLGAFAGVYTAYVLAAQATTAFDPIGTRLLSPWYVPPLVVVLVGLDRTIGLSLDVCPQQRVALGGLTVLLLAAHGYGMVDQALTAGREGIGDASCAHGSWEVHRPVTSPRNDSICD